MTTQKRLSPPQRGTLPSLCLALLVAALLAACSGGSSSVPPPQPPVEPAEPVITGPGEFKSANSLGTISVEAISNAIKAAADKAPAITPRYAVNTYRLEYLTLDGQGAQLRASALVCVPVKAAGSASPVLAYQHGTTPKDAEAPSNHAVADEAAVVMASAGYIVLAPDYVGYGVTKGQPHPYLLAAPSASVVNDLLVAATTWRKAQGIVDNQQLFLAGYSEGGYVTMAAARALEQANTSPLLAQRSRLQSVVIGAGPYHVGVAIDGLLALVREDNPLLNAVLRPGVLKLLSADLRIRIRDQLLKKALGSDADVVFQGDFLDMYLADDSDALERRSNVHNWKPEKALRLYHGRDDRTVPYAASTKALESIQAQGAGGLVSLNDCSAVPAGHLECVKPYWDFMMGQFASQARDL